MRKAPMGAWRTTELRGCDSRRRGGGGHCKGGQEAYMGISRLVWDVEAFASS